MTIWQIVAAVSLLGGIIGGMGMGGGTLLIPLLTAVAGLEQHIAQAVNLTAFIPMAIAALAVHRKNGYVNLKCSAPITALSVAGAIAGSFAAGYSGGDVLRMCYGALLIVIGVCVLVVSVKKISNSLREKAIEEKKLKIR